MLAPYAITTRIDDHRPLSLFRHAMVDAFARLPEPVRNLHDRTASFRTHSMAEITVAANALTRLLNMLDVLPASGTDIRAEVIFTLDEGRERLIRRFGAFSRSSVLGRPGDGCVWETFGPIAGKLRLVAGLDGFDMEAAGFRHFGIPAPRFLWLRAWGRGGSTMRDGSPSMSGSACR